MNFASRIVTEIQEKIRDWKMESLIFNSQPAL